MENAFKEEMEDDGMVSITVPKKDVKKVVAYCDDNGIECSKDDD